MFSKSTFIIGVVLVTFLLGFYIAGSQTQAEEEPAQIEQVVNVYSSRKEKLIKSIFNRFTKNTGIKVNFVTDKPAKLIARLESEGVNSPADLFLTADIANLTLAKDKELLQPITSEALVNNIPAPYRDLENYWYGLSLRARVLVYAKDRVQPGDLSTYEDLADPKWKERILVRSSSNTYNQSLIASLIANNGLEATEEWAKGLVANFARKPQGGDTDQIRAVAAGEGDVAIVNSYYLGRLIQSDFAENTAVVEKVGIFFPNQEDRGTHVNVSGGGVTTHAKNKDNAITLLEYLSGEDAQRMYAWVNHEFAVTPGVPKSDIAKQWGDFQEDALPLTQIGMHVSDAVKLTDRVGWR